MKKLFKRKSKKSEGQVPMTTGYEKPASSTTEPRRIATPTAPSTPQNNGAKMEAVNRRKVEETAIVSPTPQPETSKPENNSIPSSRPVPSTSAVSNGSGSKPPQSTEAINRSVERNELNSSDSDDDELTGSRKDDKGVSESFRGLSEDDRFEVDNNLGPTGVVDADYHASLGDAYDSIPLLEQTKLPRGGISMETKAVGRVQVSSYCEV